MRNKKAKALRKLAQKRTVGEPAVTYMISKSGKGHTSIITLNPNCTRAMYKKLKRAA